MVWGKLCLTGAHCAITSTHGYSALQIDQGGAGIWRFLDARGKVLATAAAAAVAAAAAAPTLPQRFWASKLYPALHTRHLESYSLHSWQFHLGSKGSSTQVWLGTHANCTSPPPMLVCMQGPGRGERGGGRYRTKGAGT